MEEIYLNSEGFNVYSGRTPEGEVPASFSVTYAKEDTNQLVSFVIPTYRLPAIVDALLEFEMALSSRLWKEVVPDENKDEAGGS